MKNELILTATAYYKDEQVDFDFDACYDATDADSLLYLAKEKFEDIEDFDETLVTVDITNYKDVHPNYTDDDVWEYAEAFCNFRYIQEVFNAGIECGISLDSIEEAYQGEFSSDEAFAKNFAEDIGAVNDDAEWPNNCIDWSQAANELMMDYCEEDSYYFRVM